MLKLSALVQIRSKLESQQEHKNSASGLTVGLPSLVSSVCLHEWSGGVAVQLRRVLRSREKPWKPIMVKLGEGGGPDQTPTPPLPVPSLTPAHTLPTRLPSRQMSLDIFYFRILSFHISSRFKQLSGLFLDVRCMYIHNYTELYCISTF